MNNVIVIGGTHHNSLGVIRSLGERGYNVEFVNYNAGGKFDYVAKSKYIIKYHQLDCIDQLYSYLQQRNYVEYREVIISCADVVTEYLNMHLEVLSERYIIPGIPQQGEMTELMDKTKMIEMVSKRGINAPNVWHLPIEKSSVSFPCITKSHISSHGGKSDIVIFYSQEELNTFIKSNKGSLFAQAYINKKEEIQLIGCSLHDGAEIIIPGMSKILRSQPNTNTGFLEYGSLDPFYLDIVEKAKLYIKDCQYSGLFSFEIIRGVDEKIWFLDITYRNDGNAWCVTKSGINLPVIWVKACYGDDYKNEICTPKQLLMMPELQDFKLVLQRKVSFIQWCKDWKRTDYFMEYDKQDKKPFFFAILNKLHLV